MNECIIIAKLIGILSSELNKSDLNKYDLYKIDCYEKSYDIIIQKSEIKEVKIININTDLSYNIKLK